MNPPNPFQPWLAAAFSLNAVIASAFVDNAVIRTAFVALTIVWLLLYIASQRLSRTLRDDLHSLMNEFQRIHSETQK